MTPPRALAVTHVTLIDVSSGPRPDVTIVLQGERIVAVGPSASLHIPSDATVYDAAGRFAIPGLWDAHVHLSQGGPDAIPLYVANGITSVRDMGSDLDDVTRWKRARSAGDLIPRIFSPGPKLAGGGTRSPEKWVVVSSTEARAAVAQLRARGADFIKVHEGLSRASYDAIAEACRENGLNFAGHARGGDVSPLVAVAAGQRTIEHGSGMLACSPALWERIRASPEAARIGEYCAPADTRDAILPAMARTGTWFTPTLASWRGHRLAVDPVAAASTRLVGAEYVYPALERRWQRELEPTAPPVLREVFAEFGSLAAAASRAGVHVLAGTDVGDPYVIPGFALHDELELLVEAGVPALQALRAATLEPALALGVAREVGTIETGKAADLVLLAADPLADIRNTRRIVAVILNGRMLTEGELRSLLAPLRRDRG